MKKYIAEFLGTFTLVFFGTGAVMVNNMHHSIGVLGIGITFGIVVMAMIYAFGNISGAHINPAVTIAFAVAKKIDKKELLPYVVFQIVGAILASFVLKVLFPQEISFGETMPSGTIFQSFILEYILSLILMLVILRVATNGKETGIIAALAIGGVVFLEATVFGPICGASMNPARSIAPALAAGNLQHLWLYIIAPILGMLTAVLLQKVFD